MPAVRITPEQAERITKAVEEHGSINAAARALGIGGTTAYRHYTLAKQGITGQPKTWVEQETRDQKIVDMRQCRIKDIEDAYDKAGLDRLVWTIEKVIIGGNDVTLKLKDNDGLHYPFTRQNQNIRVIFRRIVSASVADAMAALAKRIVPTKWPTIARPKRSKGEQLLGEVSIIDHHFGKLAWAVETGESYDVKIASSLYASAVAEIADYLRSRKVSRVAYVVGHDLLHAAGEENETVKGTRVDCDGRWTKTYTTAFDCVAAGIEQMALVAPVDVYCIPGNHDGNNVFLIGHSLAQRYRFCKDINVDYRPTPRKMIRHGCVMVGLCHGNLKDDPPVQALPLDLAQKWKKDWAETTWREIHLGDQHRITSGHTPSREKRYVEDSETYNGVVVRRLPSLCGTDAWHYGKAFYGLRASEVHIWSDKRGPAGTMIVPFDALGTN